MKVLHLIDSGGLYGAERMLLSLASEQVKQGLDPMILSARSLGAFEKDIDREAKCIGVPVIGWQMEPGYNLKQIRQIQQWTMEHGFDVLHSHGYKFDILLNSRRRVHAKQVNVSTVHGYTANSIFSRLALYKYLDRFFLKRADGVAVVSRELHRLFRRHRNALFIPNGIPPTLDGSEFDTTGFDGCDVVLSVGRLSPEKRVDALIRAFSDVALSHPKLKLVIAGEGPERKALEELVKNLGLEARVVFVGFSTNSCGLIERAAVLVISSDSEGLPMTLLEAMRAKTPVVSNSVGEIPHVLNWGEFGTLSRSNTVQELAAGIREVLNHADAAKYKAIEGQKEFLKKYTSSAMAEKYLLLYERCFR